MWANNKANGKGSLYIGDGSIYTGEFVDNTFCGHGVLEGEDGMKYDGEWKDDVYNGTCK